MSDSPSAVMSDSLSASTAACVEARFALCRGRPLPSCDLPVVRQRMPSLEHIPPPPPAIAIAAAAAAATTTMSSEALAFLASRLAQA